MIIGAVSMWLCCGRNPGSISAESGAAPKNAASPPKAERKVVAVMIKISAFRFISNLQNYIKKPVSYVFSIANNDQERYGGLPYLLPKKTLPYQEI